MIPTWDYANWRDQASESILQDSSQTSYKDRASSRLNPHYSTFTLACRSAPADLYVGCWPSRRLPRDPPSIYEWSAYRVLTTAFGASYSFCGSLEPASYAYPAVFWESQFHLIISAEQRFLGSCFYPHLQPQRRQPRRCHASSLQSFLAEALFTVNCALSDSS